MIWCMETVKELRGATWVAFLLEKGEFKSLADMHKVLGVVENVQLWSAYKSGKASPQETTVKLVDRVVPGSASTWFNGLHVLPLWAVLEGDMAVCQRVVVDLLNQGEQVFACFACRDGHRCAPVWYRISYHGFWLVRRRSSYAGEQRLAGELHGLAVVF